MCVCVCVCVCVTNSHWKPHINLNYHYQNTNNTKIREQFPLFHSFDHTSQQLKIHSIPFKKQNSYLFIFFVSQ